MNAYAVYQKEVNELQRKIMLHQYGAIMDDPSEYQDHFQKQEKIDTAVGDYMKIKCSDLVGAQLDYAVAKCSGPTMMAFFKRNEYTPSTDWEQSGPIIEREKITVSSQINGHDWAAKGAHNYSYGKTPLIAAMRCYCCSKGEEVEIPGSVAWWSGVGRSNPQGEERRMKLIENVTVLPVITTLDVDVERVLQAAIDAKPKYVLVMGETESGGLYFASSKSDGGTAIWWMEKAKKALMELGE